MPIQTHYLSRNDNVTGKVEFRVLSTGGLPDPPVPNGTRRGSVKKTLSSFTVGTGGAIISVPGVRVVWDGGLAPSDYDIDVKTDFITAAQLAGLSALRDVTESLYYSPDNGTTVYEVSFQAGQSFVAEKNVGHPEYTLTMRFYVLSRVL